MFMVSHRAVVLIVVATLGACNPVDRGSSRTKTAKEQVLRSGGGLAGPVVPASAGPSQAGTSTLAEFEAKFRRAVLETDVEWIVAAMDPEGWTCGDAFMSASAYGAAFRRGDMDHAMLFDGEKWRKKVGVPDELSYREWFSQCPDAYAVEAADDPRPDPGRAYLIRWLGPGCPEKGPAVRIIQRPTKISIRVFGGCI